MGKHRRGSGKPPVIIGLGGGFSGRWLTGYYAAQNGVEPIGAIPWNLYTHVIHFAAAPNADGSIAAHYLTASEIAQFTSSKPAGKYALVCLKDNDSDQGAFAAATSPGTIAAFVANVAAFVNGNGYGGVDIDWETNVNVAQYVDLLKRLRAALPSKAVTMAVGNWGGLEQVAAAAYPNVDQINVMCYDMDSASAGYSWYNSALLQAGNSAVATCDWRVRAFTGAGVPASKIGVGIPLYGRRWQGTTQALTNGSFSPSTVPYRDLVSDPQRWQTANQKYDAKYKANYLSIPALNEFDSYTGAEFIGDVASWSRQFGGVMTFTLDYEYLPGGASPYPLSAALYAALFGGSAPPQPVAAPPGFAATIQQPAFLGPPTPAPAAQAIPPALLPLVQAQGAVAAQAAPQSTLPSSKVAIGIGMAIALMLIMDD
jgi:Glycosyl hydrolases family 18